MTTIAHESSAGSRGEPRMSSLADAARRSFASLTHDQAQAVLQIKPEPVAAIRRSGRDPYRILLFGGGALTGAGLASHERGLPGRIADEVVRRRSRGVSLDVVVEARPTTALALAGLAGLRLRRYDAVVVVLSGLETAHLAEARWRGEVVALTKLLITETSPAAGLFLYDSTRAVVPVMAAAPSARVLHSAERLIAVDEEVCALSQRVRFGELQPAVLPADPVRGFAAGTHQDWASWMVDRLEPALRASDQAVGDDSARRFRERPQVERLRQASVDSLRLRLGDRDPELDREVRQAKLMYQAGTAAFTIVDGATVWTCATTDPEVMAVERPLAMCDLGVRTDGLLLINDTWADPRTSGNPITQGEGAIRFYAGYPVRTWDGHRIGMVCVWGDEPRALSTSHFEGLRDVAARVESMLWRKALRPVRR